MAEQSVTASAEGTRRVYTRTEAFDVLHQARLVLAALARENYTTYEGDELVAPGEALNRGIAHGACERAADSVFQALNMLASYRADSHADVAIERWMRGPRTVEVERS